MVGCVHTLQKGDVRRSTLGMTSLLALTSLAGLSSSCSDDPEIGYLAPRGIFAPEAVDFGEISVDVQSAAMPVTLANAGNYKFVIQSVELPMGFSLRGAKGLLEGREIRPGESFDMEVVFLPTEEKVYEGQLVMKDGAVSAILDIKGTGVIRESPMLTVNPISVDFGAVALQETGRATVQVTNNGNGAGVIGRATLGSTSAEITPTDTFAIGTQLPIAIDVGQTVSIDLVFRPTLEAQISDIFILNAENHAPLQIGVTGQGVVPLGDVLCSPSRLEFGQVQRGQTTILSVNCEARGGPARLISGTITNNPMFVVSNPPTTLDLLAGDSVQIDVEFRPDGTPATVNGTLDVLYNGGMGMSTVTVALIGEVTPPLTTDTAIALDLQWTSNGTDVDLHLVRSGGTFFESPGDCYYGNDTPDWGVSGDSTDDPFLDVDDINGYGPEKINLSTAAAGRYDVYAHYFSDGANDSTESIVEIHLAGQLVATRRRPGQSCGQVWHVGTINWDGSGGTFSAVDAISYELLRADCF